MRCKLFSPGEFAINAPHELQELLMPVAFVKITDDFSLKQIQCGEQSSSSVSFVIVRHGAAATFLQRQPGLRAVQCLNLALFIHTKDDGFVGRVQVEPDNIRKLFQELRIA